MQFNLTRMLAAVGLTAASLVFLQILVANSSPDLSSRPALPVILPSIGCIAFALAAFGMLLRGVGGAASGLLIGVALGVPYLAIFVLLDVRFLFM
jgi:hypothetical protein